MKKVKHTINSIIWTAIGLVLLLVILTHVPTVQHFLGAQVSEGLSKKLNTQVEVGRVDLGLFHRVIIDDVLIYDQARKKMLQVSRLSAKIDLWHLLLDGKISISSAQIFGLKAELYKKTALSEPNFQFVLDSLASKDTTSHTPLDLHIQSLVIRHGAIKYDQWDSPTTQQLFNPKHLNLTNISTHMMLHELTDDSLSLDVKKLSFQEASGLRLKNLTFEVNAGKHGAVVKDFHLQLPHSQLSLEGLTTRYEMRDKTIDRHTLNYDIRIKSSDVTPSDLSCFVPQLKFFNNQVSFSSDIHGNGHSMTGNFDVRSSTGSIRLKGKGSVYDLSETPAWLVHIEDMMFREDRIQFVVKNLNEKTTTIPDFVTRFGTIHFQGDVHGKATNIGANGVLRTDAGNAQLRATKKGNLFDGYIETTDLNLARILDNGQFGTLSTHIQLNGSLHGDQLALVKAKGEIERIDYNTYPYQHIQIDGTYQNGIFDGLLGINDPHAKIDLQGSFNTSSRQPSGNLLVDVHYLDTKALGLTSNEEDYVLENIHLKAGKKGIDNFMNVQSDFAEVSLSGQYEYQTLAQSIANLVGSKLPTLPGLPKLTNERNNNFTINATLSDAEWLRQLFGIPLTLRQPAHLYGEMNDREHKLDMTVELPSFYYDETRYENGLIQLTSPNDTLQMFTQIRRYDDRGHRADLQLKAAAADNKLSTLLSYHSNGKQKLNGVLNAETNFFKTEQGQDAAHVTIHPSEIMVGDTIWTIEPSDIVYSKDHLIVDHFAIHHNGQHVIVSGLATKNPTDTVFVDLQDVDVSYILNLVNFHSVEFSGLASGKAYVSSAFHQPSAAVNLMVRQFQFQDGRMGTLTANATYNQEEGQINIDAIAEDGLDTQTLIYGYVSPARNLIDLDIRAKNTRLEFLESFCGSFMRNVEARGNGYVRVFGDLSEINIEGEMVANGKLGISSVNCDYTLENCRIHLIPDEIQFLGDTIRDRNGNLGIVTGAVHHKHLTSLSYDINIHANHLLAFDTKGNNGDTFYGTVYATGDCAIHGKSGETVLDINVTPEKGSQVVYNAASPDAISNREFIQWENHDTINVRQDVAEEPVIVDDDEEEPDIPTDIKINFLINSNQNLTLKLLMDNETGDYIALNGDGILRASFYNKGTFDMFGTYVVDHGIYKLTIQNIIKKDFQFDQGGTIVFGGDPYNAALNLKAFYTVNSVSLSDLNIGRSFTSNNIRVNCLMNITGTPNTPQVDFSLDMPTVGNDAKQMIYSVINSEEEMNQQVLYLLAIGRFYTQGNNNATTEDAAQQSQTSLAMQSLLSGTISQQINNVLSSVLNNNNWNFGANISTGDEGWNNAEYEGLLSGRLLNNRLLINGQFGYRDNANATTSFIGDFDIRYLLFPNGNLAIKVYNQTNDRYFTRNSLNTQGLGIILKKDFNGLRDLFGRRRMKSEKKE